MRISGFPPLVTGASVVPAVEDTLTDSALDRLADLGCLSLHTPRNTDQICIAALET